MKMNNIGKRIYGFCNGFFGRDDYDDKIIVYETDKAICCIYIDERYEGILNVANFATSEEKQKYIDEWSIKKKEEYDEL